MLVMLLVVSDDNIDQGFVQAAHQVTVLEILWRVKYAMLLLAHTGQPGPKRARALLLVVEVLLEEPGSVRHLV